MSIDWSKVREARRRGKMGIMQPGDQELCVVAMKADKDRDRKLSAEVVQEVAEEMQSMFGGERS